MDMIPDWVGFIVGNNAATTSYNVANQLFVLVNHAKSYISPLIEQVMNKPDLATLALLILILFVSLKILNMVFTTILFWLRMVFRAVVLVGVVSAGLWVYTRGPDGVTEDLQYWYDTWTGQYQHYKEQEKVARLLKQGQRQGARQGWY